MSAKNTFFTEKIYKSEINLFENEDVIKAMHADGIKPTDKFTVDLYFVTDTEVKANKLMLAIQARYPEYTELEVGAFADEFEVVVTTTPVEMNLKSINELNQLVWDLGYEFDCKFDGWEAGPLDEEDGE